MPASAVERRNTMSETEFKGLSKPEQDQVIKAKLNDSIIKPVLDRAIAQIKEAHSEMTEARKK